MSETLPNSEQLNELRGDLQSLRNELNELVQSDLVSLSDSVEDIFETMGRSIRGEIESAVSAGTVNLNDFVSRVVADLSRLAADRVVDSVFDGPLGQGNRQRRSSETRGGPFNVTIQLPTDRGDQGIRNSEAQLASAVQSAMNKAFRNA